MSGLPHNSGRSPASGAFAGMHTPNHSISGTLNQLDKEREREMDLSDAYCVVIGRAGHESQSANSTNGYVLSFKYVPTLLLSLTIRWHL